MRRTLVALAAALLGGVAPAAADGLIDNVRGYTIDEDGQLVRFTGLVIADDGNVSRLLGKGDRRPDRPDFRLDARNRVLLPGFVDAHAHVMAMGLAGGRLDLSGARSLDEAKALLARWAAEHPTPRWIVGFGWNQEAWGLGRMPNAADLDAVVPDRPVWLERVDGHAGLANSVALAEAKVTPRTAAPSGGRIEKAGGKPTGLFTDAATQLITAIVPPALPRERDAALARAQGQLLSLGVTSVTDMGTSSDDWNDFRRAGDTGRLKVRILSYALGIDPLVAIAGTRPTPWLYDGRLRMAGVKLYLDGALGSRGALLKAPYADATTERGLSLLDETRLKNLMSRASMDGFQVALHAIGDAANALALDAIEDLSATYKGDRRWRIEHAQVVDPADLPRFNRAIIASMQPVHATSDRVMAEARLGPARLAGAYAPVSIARAGARLAFGSDAPVESPDPFAALAAAVTRTDAAGNPPGGWLPGERLTVETAFAAHTAGGAYAAFAEDHIGTLQPGRAADFILTDTDPFEADAAELRATKVNETWVGGKRAWVRGETPAAADD